MYRNKLTKTEYIVGICNYDTYWKNKRGRLYYMSLDELKNLFKKSKIKWERLNNENN